MKTLISKTTASIIALLSACAISFGQASDSTYIQPKAGAANFFVEAGAAYFFASSGDANRLAGIDASIGWRASSVIKLQFETGAYFSSKTSNYYDWYYGYTNTYKVDLTVIPMLFSASFCIPLGGSGRSELRLTPSLGFCQVKLKESYDSYYGGNSYSDRYNGSSAPFAGGFGVGYTFHFNRQFYADAGLRWLAWTSSGNVGWSSNEGITLVGGWKF